MKHRLEPYRFASCFIAFIAAFVSLNDPLRGSEKDVPALVRTGVEQFAERKFDAAEGSFRTATEVDPQNDIAQFDLACTLLAAGETDQAREIFRDTALSRDTRIAADSHYNLGCLHSDEGRAILGKDPLAATGEARETSIAALMSAARQFRDCLRIDSEHVQARHNLELLRLFIKHIQSEWDRIDRERERQEKGLLEFLALLEKRQQEIRNDVRELSSLSDLSAQRQQMTEAEKKQTKLQEEIDPLKEKIAAEFASASAGQPGTAAPSASPPQLDEQTQRALEMLTAIADDAGEAMQKSASLIRSGETAAAADSQRQVLDHFHQIFLAVSPFQSVLQRAITEQDGNLNRTQPLTQPENDGQSAKDARAVADDADPEQDPATAQDDLTNTSRTAHSPTVDEDAQKEDLPWYQQRITDYSRMLTLKAESTLPAIEQQLGQLEAAATDDPPTESDEAPPEKFGDDGESVDSTDAANSASTATPSPTDESTDSDPEQQPDPAEQLRALQNALRKAIELGPSAVEHSELAGAALSTSDYSTASDEETETLRILREIAEQLPPPPEQDQSEQGEQNQDTDSDSQEDQSSDQQNDQSQQDSGEEDQEQNPEDQTEDDQKSEDEQSDGQTKDEQPEEQSSKQTPQERAESILRRAQERERKHREMQKQLRAILGERIRVERDW